MAVFFVIGFALTCGLLLIFLVALTDDKKKSEKPAAASFHGPVPFYRSCLDLVDTMKLETIEHEERENQIDITAKNPTPLTGGLLLIRGLFIPTTGVVETPQILEFSNIVLQERVIKGILVTTGSFSPELGTLAELAPIEFIDGEKLNSLREKFHLY